MEKAEDCDREKKKRWSVDLEGTFSYFKSEVCSHERKNKVGTTKECRSKRSTPTIDGACCKKVHTVAMRGKRNMSIKGKKKRNFT